MRALTLITILLCTLFIAACAAEQPPAPSAPTPLGEATADWYAEIQDFTISPDTLELSESDSIQVTIALTNHDFVFAWGYYWDGLQWVKFDLTGDQLGDSLWLADKGEYVMDVSLASHPEGIHYFVTYGCKTIATGGFDCNGQKWLINSFEVTKKELPTLPTDPDNPQECPLETAPLCGVDGITYQSQCELDNAGVELDYPGQCDEPTTSVTDFKAQPTTYTVGSGASIELIPGDDVPENFDVLFQTWSVTDKAVVANHVVKAAPYVYPSNKLDTITPGIANIQAIVRTLDANGGIVKGSKVQYDFDIEVVGQNTDPSLFKDEWEAEAGELSAGWVTENGAISHNQGILLDYADTNPTATYEFSVDEDGVYKISGLTQAPTGDADSFFVNVDVKPTQSNIWDVTQSQSFTKTQILWRDQGLQTFQLAAGPHTLYVVGREGGTQVDKWYVEKVTEDLCGNGVVNAGEVCDGGSKTCTLNGNSGTQTCNSQCNGYNTCFVQAQPVCGNRIVEAGETCDDGNTISGDKCSATCQYESSGGECSDGIDNDGDGLVDWAGTDTKGPDLGCYGPDDGSEAALSPAQEDGWYTFDKKENVDIIYVSDSTGNNNNDGLAPNRAVKTLAKGAELVAGTNNWLLLKAGDTWEKQFLHLEIDGSWDEQYPQVVGVYGAGPRPRIKSPGGDLISAFEINPDTINSIVVQGIHLDGHYRNPLNWPTGEFEGNDGKTNGVGFRIRISSDKGADTKYAKNILFQDNKAEFYDDNFQMVDDNPRIDGNSNRKVEYMTEIDLHRNIAVFAQSKDSHAVGFYTEGLLDAQVTENTLDHNGWLPTDHPNYREGKHPDDGGSWDDMKRFQRNKREHNMYMQSINDQQLIGGNLVFRGAAHGVQLRNGGDFICNIFAENAMATWTDTNAGTYSHNIITETSDMLPHDKNESFKDWRRGWGFQIADDGSTVVHNYGLYQRGSLLSNARFFDAYSANLIENNFVYDWTINKPGPVIYNGDYGWKGTSEISNYDRTLAKYAASIGLDASNKALYEAARNRPRSTWPKDLSARALYNYFSQGKNCPNLNLQ